MSVLPPCFKKIKTKPLIRLNYSINTNLASHCIQRMTKINVQINRVPSVALMLRHPCYF